jgi:hypothetical protein
LVAIVLSRADFGTCFNGTCDVGRDSAAEPDGALLYREIHFAFEAIQYNYRAYCKYDTKAEEYYYGFGCTIVSTGSKIPNAAEFTQAKQPSQETAVRVTRDALAVDTPI